MKCLNCKENDLHRYKTIKTEGLTLTLYSCPTCKATHKTFGLDKNRAIPSFPMSMTKYLKPGEVIYIVSNNALSAPTHSDEICSDCGGSKVICITLGGICESNTGPGSEWCLNSCPVRKRMKPCTTCQPTSEQNAKPEKIYCIECAFYRPGFISPVPSWFSSWHEECKSGETYSSSDHVRVYTHASLPSALNRNNDCKYFKSRKQK